ncbi:MAG: DUF4221 domain-containing protein [Muribaculaceae bacterium]|nr:DUF4221 domain-containing protein [Muribaculaceae bacterium]MDE6424330.1 DUF4221 domain-containing protein [Muribaculaceae bacterium]
MKKPFFLLLTGVILLSATACNKSSKNGTSLQTYAIAEEETLRLPLDSTTSQTTRYLQLVNDTTLAFLNEPTSEICIYSLKNPNCKDKIKIYKEGPNTVNGIDAFFIQSPDSIWLYATWGKRIFLIDHEGTLLDSFALPPTDETVSTTHSVYPYPQTTTPYIVKDGIHFLQGRSGIAIPNRLAGASLIYDSRNGEMRTGSPYPQVYGDKDEIQNKWSTFGERQTYNHITPDNRIITSFPASDSLYVWDTQSGKTTAYMADFSARPEIVSSLGPDTDTSLKNFIKAFTYGAILYDSSNKLYYRLFRSGGTVDDKDLENSLLHKPLGMVILNDSLKKVGEIMLPDDAYYPANAFVNSEGLHIVTYSDDDDFMTLKVIKVSIK